MPHLDAGALGADAHVLLDVVEPAVDALEQLDVATERDQIGAGAEGHVLVGLALEVESNWGPTRRAIARLELGEVTQTVEVSAGVTMLDTQSANRSITLDQQTVLDLPVNSRNPFQLVHVNAGVIAVRMGISQATQDQNHNRFSMNGGRGQAGLTLIDGVPAAAVDRTIADLVPHLQPGDLVMSVNGAALDDPNRGLEILRGIGQGSAVTLTAFSRNPRPPSFAA